MYIVQCAKHGVPLARKLANEAGRSEGGERRHIGICIGEICKYTNTNTNRWDRWDIRIRKQFSSNFIFVKRKKIKFIFKEGGYN